MLTLENKDRPAKVSELGKRESCIQVSDSQSKKPNSYEVLKLTKFGGTTFHESTTVDMGAPAHTPRNTSELKDYTAAKYRFTWQYRCLMAFRELPHHHPAFITLTYAKEPPTWVSARVHISAWLRRTKHYHYRVLLPARDVRDNPDEKPHYVIIEEEGPLNGRKHFHVLFFTAYPLPAGQWDDPLLKWPHGFQKIKLVSRTSEKVAMYMAKYAHKSEGRTKCSSQFGQTTTITLLSIFAFRRLTEMDPQMAQKLIRRLSLTPNFPNSTTLSYLLSRRNCLTTSQQKQPQPVMLLPETGSLTSGSQPLSNDACASPIYRSAALRRTLSTAATRQAIRAIRAVANGTFSDAFAQTLPGLKLFGRGKIFTTSTQLEPNKGTALWFTNSQYPRSKDRRARIDVLRLEQSL